MSMEIEITYGVGYGRHNDTIEVEDDATDDEIEQQVSDVVMEKLDWGWKRPE